MSNKDEENSKKLLIQELIKDLESLYISKFEKLTQIKDKESVITKLSRLFLLSRESAINPLIQELNH